ncbi:YesL family protein [Bacillus massilinigeriensis]|uniref:YesL family protein n=1 Tax=Bacillus massilionigeriensis TaxID=1805475 RepID=UPI00096B370B|nr:DUF624 domain-containing protein [Bacillus massilionigeriensis]
MEESFGSGKWFMLLNSVFQFIYLNLLWLIFSIPLITIGPSTAAMFGVVRKWIRKEDVDIFPAYVRLFRENFIHSFILGCTGAVLTVLLMVHLYLVNRMILPYQFIGLFLFGILVIIFSLIFVSVFSVMVHFRTGYQGIVKNSFFLAVEKPQLAFLKVFILFLAFFLFWKYPVMIFVLGSTVAYFIHLISHHQLIKT